MRDLMFREMNCHAVHGWQSQDSNPGYTCSFHRVAAKNSTNDLVLPKVSPEALTLIPLERRVPDY